MGIASFSMKLDELQVLHLGSASYKVTPADLVAAGAYGQAWVIGTCQRTVIVASDVAARESLLQRLPVARKHAQIFEGADGYAFLLRFACGLESKLVGECEIFGQIKESWREFSAVPSIQSRQLGSIVQQMFGDVKEIRASHLSNMGSASYGSQVRKLLGVATPGPTLLVGAGQLGQAVAPWLAASELLIWNRSIEKSQELSLAVRERNPQRPCHVLDSTPEAELEAWSRAGDVVLCIPADERRDVARIAAWQARQPHAGRIVHLGLGEAGDVSWANVPGLTSLTTLFDMLRAQSDLRCVQVTRARRACAEKAVLRSLGTSATQPHGWEDLAAFAAISP